MKKKTDITTKIAKEIFSLAKRYVPEAYDKCIIRLRHDDKACAFEVYSSVDGEWITDDDFMPADEHDESSRAIYDEWFKINNQIHSLIPNSKEFVFTTIVINKDDNISVRNDYGWDTRMMEFNRYWYNKYLKNCKQFIEAFGLH